MCLHQRPFEMFLDLFENVLSQNGNVLIAGDSNVAKFNNVLINEGCSQLINNFFGILWFYRIK